VTADSWKSPERKAAHEAVLRGFGLPHGSVLNYFSGDEPDPRSEHDTRYGMSQLSSFNHLACSSTQSHQPEISGHFSSVPSKNL
jgi:hypothetical protein